MNKLASAIELLRGLHPFVANKGAISGLMTILGQQMDTLLNEIERIQSQFSVQLATGFSIDLLGAVINTYRMDDESDEAYRTRLLSTVEEMETQTFQALSDVVENICGFIPQIDQYPDVDFVTEYGTSKNTGIVRVLVPFNKWEIYESEIRSQLDIVKAAGVYVIAESFDRYFEEFFEYVYIVDVLSAISGQCEFTDLFTTYPFRIGMSQIGISTRLLGEVIEYRLSEWDVGHWDEAWWDSEMYVVDIQDGY